MSTQRQSAATVVVGGSLYNLIGGLVLTPLGVLAVFPTFWAVFSNPGWRTALFALAASAVLAHGLYSLLVRKRVVLTRNGGAIVSHAAFGVVLRSRIHADGTYDFVRVRDARDGRIFATDWRQAYRDLLRPQFLVELHGEGWTEDLGHHWSRASALAVGKNLSEKSGLRVYDVTTAE